MTRISETQTVQMIDPGVVVIADESSGEELTYEGLSHLDHLYQTVDGVIEADHDHVVLYGADGEQIVIEKLQEFRAALDYFIRETIAAQREGGEQ